MPRKASIRKQKLANSSNAEFFRTVKFENGFRFFTAIGNYTGVAATNLDEFVAKVETIPVESVKFHFQRGDFQKWLVNTIGDTELAERINLIKETKSDEALRKQILKVTQKHLTELRKPSAQGNTTAEPNNPNEPLFLTESTPKVINAN